MSLFSPTEQHLLAVHQASLADGQLTSELVEIDLATLSESSTPADELAFSTFAAAEESTGRVYYVEFGSNGRIAYWDSQSQSNVILKDAAGQELRTGSKQEWLKLDRVGSVFYAMDGVTSMLYRFDPQTQAIDGVGSIEGLTPGSGDIAASPSNPNQLFV